VLDLSLAALRLSPAPAVVVSRDHVARGKPDPAGYLLAARRLGVPPSAVLVVEDSPVGAAAGVAAGMAVLAWPAPSFVPADFPRDCRVVRDGAELAAFLSSNVSGALDAAA
jgi:beta-phosphoglucomutase-like phosphatase (HAD superfamily)